AVGRMRAILVAERDAAHDAAIIAQLEMPPDGARLKGERRLRHGRKPQRLRRQHEIVDVAATVDRAIDAKRLVGGYDGYMRRAEQLEVLQRLAPIGRTVAARDAERVVELKAAFAAAFEIDAAILAREREVAIVRRVAAGDGIDRLAKAVRLRPARHDHLPWLAVAPRRRALRHAQHPLDGVARHRL